MSTDQTTNLGLPFLMPAQAQKHVTVNESLLRLDALVQAAVESRSVSAQPGSPADGALWIAPAGKTGPEWGAYADWSLAYYRDGAWETIAPKVGWRVFVKDEGVSVRYTGSAWTADLAIGSLNGGPLAGSRNVIINGGFDIWQRGTSFASASYGADRWHASVAHSRQTDVPSGEGLPASLQFGDASPGLPIARQRIEAANALWLAGKPVTLSFWAKSVAGTASLYAEIYSAGSADNFSAPTLRHSQVFAASSPSTSWTRCSLTIASLHADCANGLQLVIGRGNASAATTRITGVQLEVGGVATPFERRPDADEFRRCQRYYYKTFPRSVVPSQNAGYADCILMPRLAVGSYNHRWSHRLPVPMRIPPTLAFYNPAAANAQVRDLDDGTDCSLTAGLAFGQGAQVVQIYTLTPAGGGPGNALTVHLTAEAEF